MNSLCEHASVTEYACQCLDGWVDAYGNADVNTVNISCTIHTKNECNSHNCQNGATCVDMDGYYACVCPFGYTGDRCELEKDMCDINFCQNGATCTSRYFKQFNVA